MKISGTMAKRFFCSINQMDAEEECGKDGLKMCMLDCLYHQVEEEEKNIKLLSQS
jgi:hypothetical protein